MPSTRALFDYFISHLLSIFNSPAPPPAPSISNPTTTTTSLPSPPNNLISPTRSDRPLLSFNPSPDLESGNQQSPVPIPRNNDTDLPEWKRIGKVVQTVGFGGFGGLITLFVNTPVSATTHPVHYMAYLMLLCLGLATSICLIVYSVIMKGSPAVGLVQKKLIYFTLFFVVMVCFVRLQIELPHTALGFVMVPALIGMFYLFICSRRQRQTHETDA